MHYKVIVTGHIVEVYEMEKAPMIFEKEFKAEGQEMGGFREQYFDEEENRLWSRFGQFAGDQHRLNKEFHEKRNSSAGDRAKERKKQTLRDSRNKARRLAIGNFDSRSFFVTLTYPTPEINGKFFPMDDIEKADKDFKQFVQRLRRRYGKEFRYLAVREWTKKGSIHFHMITDIPFDWLPKEIGLNKKQYEEKEEVNRREMTSKLADIWGHGFTDIRRLDKTKKNKNVDNVGAYLVKYMTKHENEERLKGKKAYLPSKGLIQPVVLTDEQAQGIARKFKQKKEAFTNSYESEYLGKITYYEYNLQREYEQEQEPENVSRETVK